MIDAQKNLSGEVIPPRSSDISKFQIEIPRESFRSIQASAGGVWPILSAAAIGAAAADCTRTNISSIQPAITDRVRRSQGPRARSHVMPSPGCRVWP